jgi:hypothetical protein
MINYVLLFSIVFQVAILQKMDHGCTSINVTLCEITDVNNSHSKVDPMLAMKAYCRVGVLCQSILNLGTT